MSVTYAWSTPLSYTNPFQLYKKQENIFFHMDNFWSVFQLLLTLQQIHSSTGNDPAKKAAGIRFRVGTGISRPTADASSESAPFYLLEEIPQMQDFVLISLSPYLESFGVMNRVSSEEKNCNPDGRQPAVVCRTWYPLQKGCIQKVTGRDLVHIHQMKECKYAVWCKFTVSDVWVHLWTRGFKKSTGYPKTTWSLAMKNKMNFNRCFMLTWQLSPLMEGKDVRLCRK